MLYYGEINSRLTSSHVDKKKYGIKFFYERPSPIQPFCSGIEFKHSCELNFIYKLMYFQYDKYFNNVYCVGNVGGMAPCKNTSKCTYLTHGGKLNLSLLFLLVATIGYKADSSPAF